MSKTLKSQFEDQVMQSTIANIVNEERQKGIAQLQAQYDAWNARQAGIADLQAQYDAWSAQNNPQPVQTAQIPSITNMAEKNHQTFIQQRIAAREKALAEKAAKEAEVARQIENIPNQVENVADKVTNIFEGIGKQGAEYFGEGIEATPEEKKVSEARKAKNQAVNAMLNYDILGTYNTDNTQDLLKQIKASQPAEKNLSMPTIGGGDVANLGNAQNNLMQSLGNTKQTLQEEKELRESGTGINQVDMSKYADLLGAEDISEEDKANLVSDTNYDNAKRWIDPSYKMTKKEEEQAKKIAKTELAKLKGKKFEDMTADEQRRYQTFKDLKSKTSDVESFFVNAGNELYRVGKGLSDLALQAGSQKAAAEMRNNNAYGAALGTGQEFSDEDIQDVLNVPKETKENIRKFEEERGIPEYIANAQKQNPIASGAGSFVGGMVPYLVTTPAIGAMTEGLGITSAGGKFLANQIMQLGQDALLSYKPMIDEYMADGNVSDEEKKNFAFNFLIGTGANFVPGLFDYRADVKAAKKAAESATDAATDVVQEGVKNLPTDIANEADLSADLNRQIADAVNAYGKSDTELPKLREYSPSDYDIPDINQSTNDQFANLMKQANQSASESIPSMADDVVASVAKQADEAAESATRNVNPTLKANPELANATDDTIGILSERIESVGAKVGTIKNEKLDKAYTDVFNSFDGYTNVLKNSTDTAEINNAARELRNAINRFDTQAKKVDPGLSKELKDKYFRNVINDINTRLDDFYNGAKRSKDAADAVIEMEGINPVDDVAKSVTEAPKVNDVQTFTSERQALLDQAVQQTKNGDAMGSFETMRKVWDMDAEMQKTHPELYQDGNFVGAAKQANEAAVMAEDTGLNAAKQSDESIITESAEIPNGAKAADNADIPKTDAEAPDPNRWNIDRSDDPGDYVSKFRTNKEKSFNLTDEELNNKYFNTQNENFHFLKGDRAGDMDNAALNLETDYEGTVKKILDKPTDKQFTPQEVDEAMMAWNKEVINGRESGDFGQAANIMYRMTVDAHDKGAGLGAYASWKKNTPVGVVVDANQTARRMATDEFGKAYIDEIDNLSNQISKVLDNGKSIDDQLKEVERLMKDAQSKGYKNGVNGYDQMADVIKSGSKIDVASIHEILCAANKIPNLSAKSQADIASIASEMFGKELTSAERRKYINQINMILSKEKHWSIKDKAIEISHILMLSGTKTHLKNIVANVGMLPQEALARKISAIGQYGYKFLVDPNYKPTQAFHVGKEAKTLANAAYDSKGGAKGIVDNIVDKFTNNIGDEIGATYMFGTGKKNVAAKANDYLKQHIPGLEDLEGKAGNLGEKIAKKIGSEGAYDAMDSNVSLLENYRQFIYGSLSGLEDNPFVKRNFVDRLASYIQANGIKDLKDIPEEAFDIARAEALKATFKDDNAVTNLFKGVKNVPGVGELLLPFYKTPANLVARSIDFSPIGLARSLYGAINKNSRFAKDTVGETIDEIAKGLGGSLSMIFGMYLYNNGIITGKKSDDQDIANYMANEGWQPYSISTKGIADFINKKLGMNIDLGDNYYDFSFMQPSTTNVIAGEELWDELSDGKKITEKNADEIFNRAKSIAGSYADALLAQTTFQNISDVFGSRYSDDGMGANLIQNALEWPTRFTSGAISDSSKLIDDTRREYYSKNKPLETVKNAVMSKLPVLSEKLPAKYDVFGEEMTRNKSDGEKWFNTLLNPTTTSHKNDNPLYGYLDDINNQTQEGDYIPTKTPRTILLDDETKLDLDNKQYSALSKSLGETRSEYIKQAQESELFKSLDAEKKVEVLEALEKANLAKGYQEISENAKITDQNAKYLQLIKDEGVEGLIKEVNTKSVLNDYGVTDSAAARDILENHDVKWLQNYEKIKTKLDGSTKKENVVSAINSLSGISQSDKAEYYAYAVTDASPGSNPYGFVAGVNYKPKEDKAYQQALKSYSDLTPEKYYENRSKIDTDKGGSVSQEELLNYINLYISSQTDAQKYWSAYGPVGGWTNKKGQVKKLVYKNGEYTSEY